jgi:hypothetical protein
MPNVRRGPLSEDGRRFSSSAVSAVILTADIKRRVRHVRKVPTSDIAPDDPCVFHTGTGMRSGDSGILHTRVSRALVDRHLAIRA